MPKSSGTTAFSQEAQAIMEGQPFQATVKSRPATRWALVAGLLAAAKRGLTYKEGHTLGAAIWVAAMLKTKEASAFTGEAFEANGIFVKDNTVTGTVNAESLTKVFNRLIPSGLGAMEGMLGTITIAHIAAKSAKVPLFGRLDKDAKVRLVTPKDEYISEGYAGAKVVLPA